MLEPDDRVVLTSQLRPPVGYRLEAAVATTFTLDLEAALALPLAFASHELQGTKDPIAMIEAIRSFSGKIDIFTQVGQIIVPKKGSNLMAFLEPMLHPVNSPKNGYLFHPKIWFLRYVTDGGPDRYRLLCSTRNLVNSNAWDAAVTLEGTPGNVQLEVNKPLVGLLRRLPRLPLNQPDDALKARVTELAQRAGNIEWELPPNINALKFHALGIPDTQANLDFSGSKHLVISPFCSDEGVQHIVGENRRVTLVSTSKDLDLLDHGLLDKLQGVNGEALFTLDPLARLGDSQDEEFSDLHAKITVLERNRGETHVFVGSANATDAAYKGNVEFVVELIGRKKHLGVDTLMKTDPDNAPSTTRFRDFLQPYHRDDDAPNDPEDDSHRLQKLVRDLAGIPYRLEVENGKETYSLRLTSKEELNVPPNHEVRFGLLTRPGIPQIHDTAGRADVKFTGIPLFEITPFVTLQVEDPDGAKWSTVVYARLVNDPQGRLDEILARQVDTPEKFLRFLALMLGMTNLRPPGDGNDSVESSTTPWSQVLGGGTGVLELVVNALADRRDAIRELDGLVTTLKITQNESEVFPEGFHSLWSEVMNALEALGDET